MTSVQNSITILDTMVVDMPNNLPIVLYSEDEQANRGQQQYVYPMVWRNPVSF